MAVDNQENWTPAKTVDERIIHALMVIAISWVRYSIRFHKYRFTCRDFIPTLPKVCLG